MCQIVENELRQLWKKSSDLLPQALKRKSAVEDLKTDGLARLDQFFNQHRKTVKELSADNLKKPTESDKEHLEDLQDEMMILIANCIPEKGGYNCKQKVKYKEIVIIFLACFKKWGIAYYLA